LLFFSGKPTANSNLSLSSLPTSIPHAAHQEAAGNTVDWFILQLGDFVIWVCSYLVAFDMGLENKRKIDLEERILRGN
jgi:hypothetical protein